MKIDRLLGILNILVDTNKVTINELAERFEVSKRTISRDLDTLNQSGIPIVAYPGKGGGVSVIEGYKYKRNVFSKNDIKNIFMALSGLMSIDKNTDIINLMAKILPEETKALFSKSEYLIDLSSWFKDSITMDKISNINKAIEDKKCMSIEYISKTSRKFRIIHPYKLVFKQSCWYLYSFCEDKEEFRLFKINRIVSYEILDRSFQRKVIEKFDFNNDFIVSKNPQELYEVILEYKSKDEFLLTDKIDAIFLKRDITEDTGKIIYEASNLDWVADFIISLTDKVKVLSPPELKTKIKLKIKNMKEVYEDDI